MSQISWIDALRRYNLGGTGWCIPRKGTPAYEQIMKIRRGEEMKTPKELIADLEKKTGAKPKVEKKSMTISLDDKPKPKVEEKKKAEKKPRAKKPKAEKKKAEKKDDLTTEYKHDDKEYEEKLAAFKKMVGAK